MELATVLNAACLEFAITPGRPNVFPRSTIDAFFELLSRGFEFTSFSEDLTEEVPIFGATLRSITALKKAHLRFNEYLSINWYNSAGAQLS